MILILNKLNIIFIIKLVYYLSFFITKTKFFISSLKAWTFSGVFSVLNRPFEFCVDSIPNLKIKILAQTSLEEMGVMVMTIIQILNLNVLRIQNPIIFTIICTNQCINQIMNR